MVAKPGNIFQPCFPLYVKISLIYKHFCRIRVGLNKKQWSDRKWRRLSGWALKVILFSNYNNNSKATFTYGLHTTINRADFRFCRMLVTNVVNWRWRWQRIFQISFKAESARLIIVCKPVNSMSFLWNDNMREKREANANATWRALIRDRPRGDGV
jgi:hypothetical protein